MTKKPPKRTRRKLLPKLAHTAYDVVDAEFDDIAGAEEEAREQYGRLKDDASD